MKEIFILNMNNVYTYSSNSNLLVENIMTYSTYKEVPILEIAEKLDLGPFTSDGNGTSSKLIHCPIHTNDDGVDTRSSMALNFKASNRFKCRSCGKSGNNIELVKQVLGLEFPAARAWIENKFSINGQHITQHKSVEPIPHNQPNLNNKTRIDIYESLFNSLSDPPEKWKEYLNSRGIKAETISRFRIKAFLPPGKEIESELRNKWNDKQLVNSGLFSKWGNNGKISFRFNRYGLLFPFIKNKTIQYFQARSDTNGKDKRFMNPIGEIPCVFNQVDLYSEEKL